MTADRSSSGNRRYDPDRKERIIEATLEVIAVQGVSGTTHRRIAEAADVPLGSMTYHFASLDDLIEQAFLKLTQEIAHHFDDAFRKAQTVDEAREAVVEVICGWFAVTERKMTLILELYAYVARNPQTRHVMTGWMAKSRQALERHFSPDVAASLDAMIEGASIHNFMHPDGISREAARLIVAKLTA